MKGMTGVVGKIPRGWRNIQVVHLKTVDSVAIPLYHSLPPEVQLLGPLPEGPPEKRVKLSGGSVDEGESEVAIEREAGEEGDGEREDLVGPTPVTVAAPPEPKKKVSIDMPQSPPTSFPPLSLSRRLWRGDWPGRRSEAQLSSVHAAKS